MFVDRADILPGQLADERLGMSGRGLAGRRSFSLALTHFVSPLKQASRIGHALILPPWTDGRERADVAGAGHRARDGGFRRAEIRQFHGEAVVRLSRVVQYFRGDGNSGCFFDL